MAQLAQQQAQQGQTQTLLPPNGGDASSSSSPPRGLPEGGADVSSGVASHSESWSSAGGLRLLTPEYEVRAIIAEDGEVVDGAGGALAFIEANGEVGDPQMNYAGKALHGACQVVDPADVLVGEFDSGRGYIKDAQGSVIAEISKEGSIKNNAGQGVGVFEGFSYELMPTIAAYFLLVDPSFLTSRHGIGVAR